MLHKASAQETSYSQWRNAFISTQSDTIVLDTLSIVPGSLIWKVDSNDYAIDYAKARLVWKHKPEGDSIPVRYKVIPIWLSKPYSHKNLQKYETNMLLKPYYYDAVEANSSQNFIDFGNVDYAGSFGRNLSFGNSQDVVLNSQFNLQLEGDLGDSIKLTGAITDNTVPFQPEGNTQQIQEFDRVFIKLQKKQSSIIAGDYDIKKPNAYFMNFYKRVQGGFVSHEFKTSKHGVNSTSLGASIAKGKFVRNILTPLEGNQGPYKLTGQNGETFFIVLANTERVYIDGVLQQRGEDLDYIIDYNTAEIVFMPRRLITKDLRLVVEFEFADRNYLNSLFYVNNEWKVNKKLHISFNAYSNQDSRNQSIQQNLDSAQKYFLSQIGDSIQQAFYSSVQQVDTFSNKRIQYKKMDTTVNSITYSIYQFNTNPDSAKYVLSFNFVGTQRGNYKQSISNTNGRVYEWVAPVQNIPQGDYEPIYILVTPKKQQMFSLGARYDFDSAKYLTVETALSSFDPNLFSKKDNATHEGLATRLGYEEIRALNKTKTITVQTKLNYEYVNERFRSLERFRNVEFARDWNVNNATTFETEHLASAGILVKKAKLGQLEYRLGTYRRGLSFIGYQHMGNLLVEGPMYRLLLKADVVTQDALLQRSVFYRPTVEAEKKFKRLANTALGVKYFMEHNEVRDPVNDTLLRTAFSFDVLNAYVKTNGKQNNLEANYILRHDRASVSNAFKQSTVGQTFSFSGGLLSVRNHEIRLTASYRILDISDSLLTPLKPDETLLGRIDYNFSLLKRVVTGNLLYEFGSGQELKREFAYVEVPIGQGQYVWRDYNNDNLQQLNEFELAIFPDEKKYIKVFTPTNQYVKAKYAQYNQSISINPSAIIPDSSRKGIKKIIALLYFQSAIQINNRFVGSRGVEQYNPFIAIENDSLLLQSTTSLIHSIFINRMSNKWGLDYIHTTLGGKTLLNYGIDTRGSKEHQVRTRWNINKQLTLLTVGKTGKRDFGSQFLEIRNYEISFYSIEPGLTWLLKRNQIRFTTTYKYDYRQNQPQWGNEKAVANNISLDFKYNILSSGSIGIKGVYSKIQYTGISNTGIGYTMLDGLQVGKNWLWNTHFDKRISKNIEMNLEYEGRKAGDNKTIHTGRAGVRAIF